jgi:mutator protein MutT
VSPVSIALALLVRDGRVLLAHRSPTKHAYPDCWDLVGGVVETGESPREAVVRECREEIGVEVLDPVPMAYAVDDPDLAVHAFVVTRWHGEPRNTAPEEHDDLRWFEVRDLDDLALAHAGSRAGIGAAVEAAEAAPQTQADRPR